MIFLKGCPLRCVWCANPESHSPQPEIMYHRSRCVGCGRCLEACPSTAITANATFGLITDVDACIGCGRCVDACVYGAREQVGRETTVDELMNLLRRDRAFYDHSGGGVTLTGGEPLHQWPFAAALLEASRREGIHTAMETCGHGAWDDLAALLAHLNLLFYDLKHIDAEAHRRWTGVDNRQILANLERAARGFSEVEIIVRVPYVPGVNSDADVQRRIYEHVSRLGSVRRVEVMPYHRLGTQKYSGLGRTYGLEGLAPVASSQLEHLVALGRDCGIDVRIDAT